eukprot:GDKJ01014698.1.p1 GENE.GDKJ01014698.1~~GDKJ01014698.1.p1  ORF type:complete len:959 (-),score=75.14 GDKJ01014698.1:120-2996(-)
MVQQIRVRSANMKRAEKVGFNCIKVHLDTQAEVNVIGHAAIPFAKMTEKKRNLIGFNGKVSVHQEALLSLLKDEKIVTIQGFINPIPGSRTLLNPSRINDLQKRFTIDNESFDYQIIRENGKIHRFTTMYPLQGSEREPSAVKISKVFGTPVPLNEMQMVGVIKFVHQYLACPKENVLSNTLIALGMPFPRRLLTAAISQCSVCARFTRLRATLVTRAESRLENSHGEEIIELPPEEDGEEEERLNNVTPAAEPQYMNRPPTRREVEELLREVDNVNFEEVQTLHCDYAHMETSVTGNTVYLLSVILPLGRVFLNPMRGAVRAHDTLEPILREFNVTQVVSDRAEALNLSEGVKVRHRRIPVGKKNANGYAEGFISVSRRIFQRVVFQLEATVPKYQWKKNWEIPLKICEQIWNARAAYNRMTIAHPIDYRFLPMRIVIYEERSWMILYQMKDSDVMIFDLENLVYKSVHLSQVRIIPAYAQVNALTTTRAKKVSAKDPRVRSKINEEIEVLSKWGCFADEMPSENDVVLKLIIIPTEVDGKIKVRIGIRGDLDERDVEADTELPSVEIRLLSLIRILNDREKGYEIVSLDVPKAYYQTELPRTDRIFISLPMPWGIKRILKVIPGLKEGARLWNLKADDIFERIGLKMALPGFFTSNSATFMRYMDDLIGAIKPDVKENYIKALRNEIVLDEIVQGIPQKFLGLSIVELGKEVRLSMDSFLESLDFEESVKGDLVSFGRTWIGRLGWVANFYPHLKIIHQKLASIVSLEPIQAATEAKQVLRRAKKQRLWLSLKPVLIPEIRIFTDASFNKESLTGVCGIIIQLADASWEMTDNSNLFFHKSVRIPRLIKSTFAAELEGFVRGLGFSILSQDLVMKCFEKKVKTKIFVDSRALYLAVKNKGTEDAFSRSLLNFCVQQVEAQNVHIEWCSTNHMKADCLTKEQWSPIIYQTHEMVSDK